MSERRWLNKGQPQTLQFGVLLLYVNAVLTLIFGGIFTPIGILIALGQAGGAYGIANEKKWGYWLGVSSAIVLLAFALLAITAVGIGGDIINLAFDVALLALLVHPQSREYRRIWFR